MTSEHLNAVLAEKIMLWRVTPDRFTMGGRQWLPRWRFRPDQCLTDAFRLLERADPENYAMGSEKGGEFWVRVGIAGSVGEARHTSKPKAITLAVARALGIDVRTIS